MLDVDVLELEKENNEMRTFLTNDVFRLLDDLVKNLTVTDIGSKLLLRINTATERILTL
jgi:hypothetical protein